MDTQSEDARQLITIAYWLRAQDTAGMTVEAEQPAIISFYSGKPVAAGSSLAPHADFIVTSARSVDGYEAAFAPQENGMDLSTGASFAVWRKK
jgi:hypothetical protein